MMNTVRKSENLLPFPVISAAANGDTTAMCAILKHYEGYIAKLCTRTLKRKPDCFAVKQYKKYKLASGDICSK